MDTKQMIEGGKTYLGIEFGSTRIKAVMTDEKGNVLASGSHEWENRYENGVWTYSMDMVWDGLRDCYAELKKDVKDKYDTVVNNYAAIGFSAMMHGYLAFDKNGELLVPFRTWRNTITEQAADILTKEFDYNIPQRWSIAHLYQAVLNKEEHCKDIDFFTTLAGYVHWKLTGKKVLGVGDASGMFPIDLSTGDFNEKMICRFDALISGEGFGWKLRDIMPKVLSAGEEAGALTEEGAKMLDPDADLKPGIIFAPAEGDAGTGMTATNSVGVRTGNVSAGTSIFAMVVLEKELSKVYRQIDLVTTPDGALVGMVHCNNCTSDINAWVNIFDEFANLAGKPVDKNDLYTMLFNVAMKGDPDCGGLVSYNYFSGEPVTGFDAGAPMFVRKAEDKFTLANFMRMHIYSSLAALKYGLDIMFKEEHVNCDEMFGHGGLFKTPVVGQSIAAAAMDTPVSVMETAGEGGPWGMALLAAFTDAKRKDTSLTLPKFLNERIFAGNKGSKIEPDKEAVKGFDRFMERYIKGLPAEKAALEI